VVRAAKDLHFNKNMEALKKMQAGADKLATVVGVTLGPKVCTAVAALAVFLQQATHMHQRTKDNMDKMFHCMLSGQQSPEFHGLPHARGFSSCRGLEASAWTENSKGCKQAVVLQLRVCYCSCCVQTASAACSITAAPGLSSR
jgi:hypothetical protein